MWLGGRVWIWVWASVAWVRHMWLYEDMSKSRAHRKATAMPTVAPMNTRIEVPASDVLPGDVIVSFQVGTVLSVETRAAESGELKAYITVRGRFGDKDRVWNFGASTPLIVVRPNGEWGK